MKMKTTMKTNDETKKMKKWKWFYKHFEIKYKKQFEMWKRMRISRLNTKVNSKYEEQWKK